MAESFESARALILEKVSILPAESIPLVEAGGRILSSALSALCDLPSWDNSAMDGFAVRSQDCGTDQPLRIDGYIPAGASAEGIQVKPGTAVRIMTGAPVPMGCDTIVPVEETQENGDQVFIKGAVQVGDHIRKRGEDVKQGEEVLAAGSILLPAGINILAAFGYSQVAVIRRPRVAILSTGDELVEPGDPLGPGQIINSNAYSLAAAIREVGAEPLLLGIARDDHESLKEKLTAGLKADVLITTAGVSMGDRDLVCEVLQELKVERLFWKIDIKPGRPTAFSFKDGTPVFSLPGNPVSSMVTFEEFVRPALLKMMGHSRLIKPYVKARLKENFSKKPGRVQFLRVRVVDTGEHLLASSSGDQNTGILSTMLRANGIAVLPAERGRFEAGEELSIHLIGELDSPY
ncbi:gephyrin-like molybdotransferase Glp [Geopsychrobacter electrodiphilus]|uniref:molybdopterin molybdotransferase MoeA n=1 Tax=Geopsychrobacter electrodiphilus TaxID=225196 RepID=UPI000363D9AC|nr:gephyrin-like molybdotransferase Glp [Geopsychrobacter electrodiphilus]